MSIIFGVPLIGTATKYAIENWDTVWEVVKGVFSFAIVAVLVTYWVSSRKR